MRGWVQRHITLLVGIAVTGTIIGIGLSAMTETTTTARLTNARQLYGLTAFGFVLTSVLIGPFIAVFPALPWKSVLLASRRAIGVSSCVIAIPHVGCYLVPTVLQNWRDLLSPGLLWVSGLVVGALALTDLSVLAWTSRDSMVQSLGGRRWKTLHRTIYIAVPLVFVHALLLGSDFGRANTPDAKGDVGALVAFSILASAWVILASLRWRGVRWPARAIAQGDSIS